MPYEELYVRIGLTTFAGLLPKGSLSIRVHQITVHPDYSFNEKSVKNDIAVLELETAVDLKSNPYIKPACLPYKSLNSDFIGKMATAIGWGALREGQSPDHLQELKLKVLGQYNCGKWPKSYVGDEKYCAGDLAGHTSTCQGDSGGPTVVYDSNNNNSLTLIGVTSFSMDKPNKICGTKNYPAVYTDVTFFIQNGWLMKQLPNLNTCPAKGNDGDFKQKVPPTGAVSMPLTGSFTVTNTCPENFGNWRYEKILAITNIKECKMACLRNQFCKFWVFQRFPKKICHNRGSLDFNQWEKMKKYITVGMKLCRDKI